MSLLCSMAEFPFYRPAIRKAEPAGALTKALEAGCSQVSCLCTYSSYSCIMLCELYSSSLCQQGMFT